MRGLPVLIGGMAAALAFSGSGMAKTPAADVPPGVLVTWVRATPAGEAAALGGGGTAGAAALLRQLQAPVFASTDGRPFYTHAKETTDQLVCTGDCLQTWEPAAAPKGAKATGDWSLVKREDGARQWAYRGKPLYTYAREIAWRDTPHDDHQRRAPESMRPVAGHGVGDVWSVADARASNWLKAPVGFSVLEFPMGQGQVLLNDAKQPLYAFGRKPQAEASLPEEFKPNLASALDNPVGDFTVVDRPDGSRQWAYKGKALYTFAGDYVPGDLNGSDPANSMEPAYVIRYFMPDGVKVEKDEFRGGRLATSKTGHTLYMRDRHYRGGLSYYIRPQGRGNPVVGQAIGIAGCDANCEKEWRPLVAAKGAAPSSYWTLVDRPDGEKQWAYRGYPLYSRPSEPAGSVEGSDTWDIALDHGDGNAPPEVFSLGLVWRAAVP